MAKKKKHQMEQKLREKMKKDRLQKGSVWVAAYAGSDIVNDYSKEFAVSLDRAAMDLKSLGYTLSPEELRKFLDEAPAEELMVEDMLDGAWEKVDIEARKSDRGQRDPFKDFKKINDPLFRDIYWNGQGINRISKYRATLPMPQVKFGDLDESNKQKMHRLLDELFPNWIGYIHWPPKQDERDMILGFLSTDISNGMAYTSQDTKNIDWKRWCEAFDNNIIDPDNSFEILPKFEVLPDKEMRAILDQFIEEYGATRNPDDLAKTSTKTVEDLIREDEEFLNSPIPKELFELGEMIRSLFLLD
jgi:hypothetical protein